MIRKLLCFLGFHDWRYYEPGKGLKKCEQCQLEKKKYAGSWFKITN